MDGVQGETDDFKKTGQNYNFCFLSDLFSISSQIDYFIT